MLKFCLEHLVVSQKEIKGPALNKCPVLNKYDRRLLLGCTNFDSLHSYEFQHFSRVGYEYVIRMIVINHFKMDGIVNGRFTRYDFLSHEKVCDTPTI